MIHDMNTTHSAAVKNMKVLLISHTCISRTEGQPRAEQLARLPGIELCVLAPDRWFLYGEWISAEPPSQNEFAYQVERIALPWTGPGQWYLHFYPRLALKLRQFRPDIIDLWEEPYGLVSAHACWLRNKVLPNARIVTETEQNILKTLPPPFENFRKYTLRNTDYAVGRSCEAVDVLRAKGYHGPAEAIPNAVDTDFFRPLDRAACREAIGIDGFVIGYVGRLVEEKGVMDIIDALASCNVSVNAIFVGGGPMREPLEARAKELGLAARVRFLGPRPSEQLPRIINAIDALVLVSRTTSRWKEQFGRVIIEAQACGTPVIGSSSGAIPQVVRRGGVIVPEQNPKALAAAVNAFSECPEKRLEMGILGRQQVKSECTWARVAERMKDIYCKLV
jgi:glycosyltransferase involved in cell wall biosynthesis